MITAQLSPSDLSLTIERELEIAAPPQSVFDAILEEIAPSNLLPDGSSFPMVIEPRVGGRWFRDLGNDTGHLWGHVQVIKPPTILEIIGPLFMSYPALNHVQYKVAEHPAGSVLHFTHRAFGFVDPEHAEGVSMGWVPLLDRIVNTAQS